MRCPCCGANLILDKKNDLASCQYCGYEGLLSRLLKKNEASAPVSQPAVKTIRGNLFISMLPDGYPSLVFVSILDCGMNFSIKKGETRAFHLEPGVHRISVSVGKSRTTRIVVIPNDDRHVKFDILFNPSLTIKIDQPKVDGRYAALQDGLMPAQSAGHALAIIALLLGASGFGSFPGFVIAMLNLSMKQKNSVQTNTLDIIAMVVSILSGMFWMIIISAIGSAGGR